MPIGPDVGSGGSRVDESSLRLTWQIKILYGVGEIAGSVRLVVFGLFLFFFYTTVLKLPGTLVGIAATIGLVWNAVVDPYLGHASDRAERWLGRRHTFMVIGTATTGLAFWALFSPPRGLTTIWLFVWLVVTSLLVRLAGSVFGIPYRALGAELSQDYDERSAIAGIRGACGLVGYLLVASLVFVVFFPNTLPGVDPKLDFARYPSMGFAFGAVITAVNLIATVSTLPLRSRLGQTRASRTRAWGFGAGVVTALRLPAFRVLLVSSSLIWLGVVINTLLFVHFLTYYVKIIDSRALSSLQLAFYGCAVLAVPVWLRVAKRIEKRWLFLFATVAAAALMAAARLLVGPGHIFGTGDVRPLLVGEALAGVFTSLFWIVPASMMADIADADALATGLRREGMFFGLASFGEQVAAGVSVLSVGFLLDRFAGLVPGQAAPSAATIERIGILYGFIPAAILILAALLILPYPLSRARMSEIQSRLENIRSAGGAVSLP